MYSTCSSVGNSAVLDRGLLSGGGERLAQRRIVFYAPLLGQRLQQRISHEICLGGDDDLIDNQVEHRLRRKENLPDLKTEKGERAAGGRRSG